MIWFQHRPVAAEDRGATVLEMAIILPVIFLITFTIISGAIYFHARTLAMAAAQEGLQQVRVLNGSTGKGEEVARSFLERADPKRILRDVDVSRTRTATTATVTVTGQALSLVPGLNLKVEQSASGPVERFTN